jgi:hypothetical protein
MISTGAAFEIERLCERLSSATVQTQQATSTRTKAPLRSLDEGGTIAQQL